MPATIGLIKYGLKRFSYNVDDTRCASVFGSIGRSSLNRYMLVLNRNNSFLKCRVSIRNRIREYRVWTSVANPERPRNTFSPIGKILGKSVETVIACCPSRKSHAIPTQSFPMRATIEPPLIEKGSDNVVMSGESEIPRDARPKISRPLTLGVSKLCRLLHFDVWKLESDLPLTSATGTQDGSSQLSAEEEDEWR